MKRILREIERSRESSIDLAIATVVAVRGSAPHPPGTKLSVAADSIEQGLPCGGQLAYIGALGSRRTQHERGIRLAERGVSDQQLDRLAAPVGIGIGATSAEETALSIAAEIVAVLHRPVGERLTDGVGQIHSNTSASG